MFVLPWQVNTSLNIIEAPVLASMAILVLEALYTTKALSRSRRRCAGSQRYTVLQQKLLGRRLYHSLPSGTACEGSGHLACHVELRTF